MPVELNTISGVRSALLKKQISAVELVKTHFDRIHNTENLNNFISPCFDRAVNSACKIDKAIANGSAESMPLLGVTLGVKDNIDVAGERTTCGSRVFENNTAKATAECVELLESRGAIVLGKTNMDELAMGSTNESSAFGAVKNVMDETRVPGGSSGGSANAVAAGQALCALGTDTGGSIRQPAAYCGVVGLKPTFGAVSTKGLVGFSPSLDAVGVFAKTCDDAYSVFLGATGKPRGEDRKIKTLKVGIADEFLSCSVSDGVQKAFDAAVSALKAAGAEIKRVSVKSFSAALSAYHVLSGAEVAVNIKNAVRDSARLQLLGDEVKRRMIIGALVTKGERYDRIYLRAAKVRAAVKREYTEALKDCDILLCPSTSSAATPIGYKDPTVTHACDYFLAPVSLAGLPAVSVPCGSENGLPVGVQIIGDYNCEKLILDAGKMLGIVL